MTESPEIQSFSPKRSNAFAEFGRGSFASLSWLAGSPIVNARIVRSARDMNEARQMIASHFARFLERCHIDVHVDGPLPKPGVGCVVCYNESSFSDVAAYGKVMWPHLDRAAAADIYSFIPFGRAATQKAGIEMVPRGNRAGTDRLLAKMVEAVQRGERLAWGGEGKIQGFDGVGRFKIGASLIAIRAQVPVVPVTFFGGHHTLPLGSVRARPGQIKVRFGEPIPTAGVTEDNARVFAD
ncbi:MAG: lysophospholipid acyltransferase family protein, partial [Boseongicola sp.]|nr:lysophospholipid acyltransferase family protein [Boseongicola sp.]